MTTDLQAAWDRLSSGGESAGTFTRLRLWSSDRPALYAARRTSDGRTSLLLEVNTAELPSEFKVPSTIGVEGVAEPVVPGPHGRTAVGIVASDDRFADLFDSLCADVVAVLELTAPTADQASVFANRVHRWVTFLRVHGGDGLSMEAQVGLFGELWFLRARLLPALVQPAAAVSAWRGPFGDPQDFQAAGCAVEVKTTTAVTPSAVRMADLGQLENAAARRIFLWIEHVRAAAIGYWSLPQLIQILRDECPPPALFDLEDALFAVGYLDRHAERYTCRYSPVAAMAFEVREGFPRLRLVDMPAGVTGVSYVLSLSACRPFSVDLEVPVHTLAART